MASGNGFGRKLAKFLGVKFEDGYEKPPVSTYDERSEAYMNARERNRPEPRSLPSGGRTVASVKRSTYGDYDRDPGTSRYGFEEDDEYYGRSTNEPRYNQRGSASGAQMSHRGRQVSNLPRNNVQSRFVEEPPRRSVNSPSRETPRGEQTVMFELYELRDANKVISALVQGNTIVLTIINPDPSMCMRIVDTLCGAAYALKASISQASERTYLLAPHSVSVRTAETRLERRRY